MVMHARKPQRINDGYFEKHQTHPYQNSKYSSSKGSYGSGGERYERIRDSPNGNSYRSDSPDSQSPRDRDRAYQSKGSYLQKIREKERENRDYKMSREKYSGTYCARSPKEKRSRETRDSEHRTNHDRGITDDKLVMHSLKATSQNSSRDRKPMHNCQDKQQRVEERDRVTRVGDWSEHISSSGKKYYYNCKTEVSQWEKPREWVERERDRDRDRFNRSSKEGSGSGVDGRSYSSSGSSSRSSGHDKHSSSSSSNSRSGGGGGGGCGTRDKGGGGSRHWTNSRVTGGDETVTTVAESLDPRRKHQSSDSDRDMQTTQQDMDISPGDSTPTSEMSYGHTPSTSRGGNGEQQQAVTPQGAEAHQDAGSTPTGPVLLANALPRLQESTPSMVPPPTSVVTTCNTPGPPPPVTLASLPRILSQITGSKQMEPQEVNHQKALQTIQNALLMSRQGNGVQPGSQETVSEHSNGATSLPGGTEGPPTPTHSESQDCIDARKSLAAVASPPASLSSLQGVAALRSTGPTITPSLSNYYRDDLVNHVRGWPADILEKQAQKLSDESHIMGSLQCTKVSAELKSARSIVRLTEIQATLQEQRILFLRQQIKTLEDMKSQNSFMSDDL